MDTGIVIAIIGAIEALGVAIIGALVARSSKRSAEAEASRMERDARLYDLVFACATGTEVLLHQAHGEKVNGNVDEALAQLQRAKAECNHVINKQAARL